MLKTTKKFGSIFMLSSFIPLGFFCYTLLHLDTLKISLSHPLVIVEALFCIVLLIVEMYRYQKKQR